MFCGLVIISSKFVVCISLTISLSFMFDDFDVANLAPKHICLCCIMLNTKNRNKWCFEIDNEFHPNSLNVLHEFVVIIFIWSIVHFGDTNSKRK
jgi:hypothetical protein